MVCGRAGSDSVKDLMGLVRKFKIHDNVVNILFADGEHAFLQIGQIQETSVYLNGKQCTGQLVVARVSADGKSWFLLHKDGKVDQRL
jgi:prepilin-type processing-associated H-X9-DG protein